MEIIFATKNKGKIREVKKILNDANIELLSLHDLKNVPEIVEDGNTFEENAKIKAKIIYDKFHIPVIAEDSGLSVEQLNGTPGIFSARYAGENASDKQNNLKLIENLKSLPQPHTAKFICAAVYYGGKDFKSTLGEMKGKVIEELHGKNGFGYDPLFIAEGNDKTNAELDPDEKNKISHRYKAFEKLKKVLQN